MSGLHAECPGPHHDKVEAQLFVGSLMRVLSEHVTEAHQTLADIAREWDQTLLLQEEERHQRLRSFLGRTRRLRAACDVALELGTAAVLEGGGGGGDETGSTSSCSGGEAESAEVSAEHSSEAEDVQLPSCGAAKGMVPPLNLTAVSACGTSRGLELSFYVSCGSTRLGQHVRVVGSCDALGAWDPLRGLPLRTTAADFPLWGPGGALRAGAGDVVEYKYVVCDHAGAPVRWEERPNRRLRLAPAAARAGCSSQRRLAVAETFGTRDDPEGAPRLRGPSGLGPALGAALCTPRCPLLESVPFTPTARRHLTPGATPRPQAVAGAAAAPGLPALRLAREDGLSQLCERPGRGTAPGAAFRSRYELLGDGPLAEGSFGLVWRCRPRAGEQELAAKIIHQTEMLVHGQGSHISLKDEVDLHRTLQHPNVVSLIEYFDEGLSLTLVLEYCEGGDLFDAIAAERIGRAGGGGLPECGAATMARHILAALVYVHGRSIVHRDVKCENVLIARARTPLVDNAFKLGDFGFAAVDDGAGLQGQVGSPDTVAPEVVAGKVYSCPADMWSMGAVLYMTLAAESPFLGGTDKEVLQRVLVGDYSLTGGPWESISPPAARLVEALMTVSSKLRPSALQALQREWLQPCPSLDRPAGLQPLCRRERIGAPFGGLPAPLQEEGPAAC